MTYLYVASFGFLVDSFSRWRWDQIVIISWNDSVLEFCKRVGVTTVIISKCLGSGREDFIIFRDYLRNAFKNYRNETVVFGHNSHDYWGLFLMEYMREIGNYVCYIPCEMGYVVIPFSDLLKSKKALRLQLDSLILRKLTGTRLDILFSGGKYFLGKSEESLKKEYNRCSQVQTRCVRIYNEENTKKKYNFEDISYVLIEQGESFYTYPDDIIDVLVELNKKKGLILKQHPRLKTYHEVLLSNMSQIACEVPIELVCDEDTIFIGVASGALKNRNTSISLLKLVNITESLRDSYMNFLGDKGVIFPCSIRELKQRLYG